jgi:iron complex transport system permease protein
VSHDRRASQRGLGVIVLILAAATLLSPWFGAERIHVPAAIGDLVHGVASRDARILSLRLPRIVLALLAGGALAITGASFQTLLRNSLATPYTLGVSFAGALGAFLALSIPPLAFHVGPISSVALLAFLFAAGDVLLLYALARRPQRLRTHELLLAGVTLNFFCGAVILLIRFLTDPLRLQAMDHWMMGGLQVSGWGELVAIPVFVLPGLLWILGEAAALDQLAFGEEVAAARGVRVGRTQRNVLLAGSLLTATVVSVTGPIGFVGLIAPHAVRRLVGPGHRLLLPGSFLLGAAFLVVADGLARQIDLIGRGAELPVGIPTAIVGAPLFLVLLLWRR